MKFLKWLWKHLFIIIIATVVTIFMGYLATRWIRYNDHIYIDIYFKIAMENLHGQVLQQLLQ
ncbi:hypothetical protein [Pediococcus pentosaceus]|uniref:hypothetical protein n=1 Tax=Pediococcus pentosaceus TaxID=1255 RepID=UPI0011B7C3FA|nr:hypothetical protein [Pediococcus pentosaceus]QDZ71030.1 hypothetical protein PSL001_09125 [Pediococcus pentosaceus]